MNIKDLSKELKNNVFTLWQLDNILADKGFISIYPTINPNSFINKKNISYWLWFEDKGINIKFCILSIDRKNPYDTFIQVKSVKEVEYKP